MRNRILSMLLAIALLVSLLPVVVAAAEETQEFYASAELIEVIKKWEGFAEKPYWDYAQWTVGYGTKAPDADLARYKAEGISKEEATKLLDAEIAKDCKSVNNFIAKFLKIFIIL